MIKITNGVMVIEVTKGAFEGVFKSQGYYPVNDNKNANRKREAAEEANEERDADEFADLVQKPIGQWTKQEVKDFAAAKSIDISKTKNANEAKAIISEYLRA